MVGPPSDLNLRNILWHGFASPTEIPREYVGYHIHSWLWTATHTHTHTHTRVHDRYAYLFFIIVSSLGKILQSATPSLPFNHRPFITFPQEAVFGNVFRGGGTHTHMEYYTTSLTCNV